MQKERVRVIEKIPLCPGASEENAGGGGVRKWTGFFFFFIVRELNPLRSSRERWCLAGSIWAPLLPDMKYMT